MRTIAGFRSRPFKGIGAVLLVLFMALVALAASPQLHQAIHDDANTPGHHCAISTLSQGQIEPPVCDAPLCLAPIPAPYSTPFVLSVSGGVAELLPPGRAPPIVFS